MYPQYRLAMFFAALQSAFTSYLSKRVSASRYSRSEHGTNRGGS
ncbi:hypothetical protein SAMN05216388_10751, partial [Halorientalis persicus]